MKYPAQWNMVSDRCIHASTPGTVEHGVRWVHPRFHPRHSGTWCQVGASTLPPPAQWNMVSGGCIHASTPGTVEHGVRWVHPRFHPRHSGTWCQVGASTLPLPDYTEAQGVSAAETDPGQSLASYWTYSTVRLNSE